MLSLTGKLTELSGGNTTVTTDLVLLCKLRASCNPAQTSHNLKHLYSENVMA